MHRAKLAALVGVAALTVGVLPTAAGGNDWGTWTFGGGRTSWNGTFFDAHRVTGITLGLRSLVKYNSVTSFKIGGKTCQLSQSHGNGYCYTIRVPANKKIKWTLTTRRPVLSSDGLVPCIKWNGTYHCRYGNG